MAILNEEKLTQEQVIIENLLHDSSNILKSSYNFNTRQLYITFKNGGVYYYNEVPHNIYEDLKRSDSVGKFLNSNIKKINTAVKVGIVDPDQLNELKEKINTFKGDL